jgi:hypothetical protein
MTAGDGDVFADPVAAAQAAAEAVRALNHATLPAAGGLTHPADAQAVLAALGMASARLPQALNQLRRFLDEQVTAGRVRVVDGEHAGDPAAMLTEAGHLLDHATIAARGLAQLLDAAADTLTWAAATPEPGDTGR